MMKLFMVLFSKELKSLFRQRLSIFWILWFPAVLFLTLLLSGSAQRDLGIEVVVRDETQSHQFDARLRGIVDQMKLGRFISVSAVGGASVDVMTVVVDVPACADQPTAGAAKCVVVVRSPKSQGSLASHAVIVVSSLTRQIAQNVNSSQEVVEVLADLPGQGGRPLTPTQFLLSGVMILALVSAGINSTSAAIVAARERNVFRSIGRFPLSTGSYLSIVVMARVAAGVVSVMLLLVLGSLFFGLTWVGGFAALAFVTLVVTIAALVFSGIGMALAALIRTESAVGFVATVIYLPILFLGHLTFPPLRSDGAIDLIAYNPATVLVTWLRRGMFDGEYWPPNIYALSAIIALAIVLHFAGRNAAYSGLSRSA
jgi:ABC-type polysaccharide/polyol phosphate export permease